jgi:hypothetical protein
MELVHLEQAILQHENGLIQFGGGNNRHCFLYNNKWYPIRFFINAALEIAGEPANINLRNSLDKLQDIFPYVKQKSININPNIPVSLTDKERLDEINILSKMIQTLSL